MFSRLYLAFLFALVIGVGIGFAQDPIPTPSPTPPVSDKQDVAPDKLLGVPSIDPNYRSDDRSMPDLGRVGVNMTDQKSLTLAEAISLALENNKDIEVTRKNVKIAEFDLKASSRFLRTEI